jgi:hypothetical protein
MIGLGSGKLEASLSNRMNNRPGRPSAPTAGPFEEQPDRSIQAPSGEITEFVKSAAVKHCSGAPRGLLMPHQVFPLNSDGSSQHIVPSCLN